MGGVWNLALAGWDWMDCIEPAFRASRRSSAGNGGDESTFRIEYNEGPRLNLLTFIMTFEGNQIQLKITGVSTFVGVMEE
ncbi:MAG TPA: hypothetical protein VI703_07210 [Anaerolineales bacterium]|jgi:hypothetical protein|nr:hypothetical protein [Anaerolineales bacterium]